VKRKDVLPAATLGTEDFDALKVEVTAGLREGVLPIPGSIHYEDTIVPEEDAAAFVAKCAGSNSASLPQTRDRDNGCSTPMETNR
jgi:hypothetical protein